MKAYKITEAEAKQLQGKKMPNGCILNPVEDINGDWFIFEISHNCTGLGTPAEYVPPINTEEL